MSIFSEENKVGSQWFSFKEVGQSLEGTVIGISRQVNRLDGKEQTVYEILTEEGQVLKYGAKPYVDKMLNRVRPVRLGQIIGIKFTGKAPSKEPGKSPTNLMEVYVNPNIVNEAWLAEYNAGLAAQEVSTVETPSEDGFDNFEPAAVEGETDNSIIAKSKESEILDLAMAKLPGVSASNVKAKIMASTRKAFVESNYDEILTSLRALE